MSWPAVATLALLHPGAAARVEVAGVGEHAPGVVPREVLALGGQLALKLAHLDALKCNNIVQPTYYTDRYLCVGNMARVLASNLNVTVKIVSTTPFLQVPSST